MSVQRKTQLILKEGTMYYQLEEFSYKRNSSMQKEFTPSRLCIISEVRAVCEGLLYTGGSLRTQEKLRKEMEAWKTEGRHMCFLLCL